MIRPQTYRRGKERTCEEVPNRGGGNAHATKTYRGRKKDTREEQSGHDDGETKGTLIPKKLMRAAITATAHATVKKALRVVSVVLSIPCRKGFEKQDHPMKPRDQIIDRIPTW